MSQPHFFENIDRVCSLPLRILFFLAGYGAAQAVPGPLFTFAAYLGAVMQPGLSGWLGGLICLAAIYLPTFLLILGILPFWEKLRRLNAVRSALMGVNAAVVGLLLAVFYDTVWTSGILSSKDFILGLVVFGLLSLWKVSPWLVVVATALECRIVGDVKNHLKCNAKENDMQRGKLDCLNRLMISVFIVSLSLTVFAGSAAWAGPPFVTDDPEPVEYRHGEFYIASQYANNKEGKEGTLPHFEFNYGPLPDLQLHLLIPFAFAHPTGGPTTYGLGDTEVGMKYRFIHETDTTPQVGTFPIVHIPTGDSGRGLGSGHVPVFFPVWLQKSWGQWTTYGGGGYWNNPGAGNKNFWQLGWLVQRDFSKFITLGAEIFYFGKNTDDGRDRTGYNIGSILNLSEEDHILFSAGSDLSGDNRFSVYFAYQWTFGPHT